VIQNDHKEQVKVYPLFFARMYFFLQIKGIVLFGAGFVALWIANRLGLEKE
jgi:hypothetical protein